MNAMRRFLLFALGLGCCSTSGRGDEFYRQFVSLVDTNQPGPLPVRSPLLTDTNNVAPKLSNAVVVLSNVCSRGEIAGVRLGMTMEAVAAAWGKPPTFWGRCFGGPRFWYNDATVAFDPSSNSVMSIIVHKLPRLGEGLSGSFSAAQFQAVLGSPAARKEDQDIDSLELTYRSPRCVLRLVFSERRLLTIRLDCPKGKE
jgi:hypothetical protein